MQIAAELTQVANIQFVADKFGTIFVCDKDNYKLFDIRVSLTADPTLLAAGDRADLFFSVIGSKSRNDARMATLNLPFKNGEFVRNKVLHEFCHALGCLHEHQRAECNTEFDLDAIRASNTVSEEYIQTNIVSLPSSEAFYGATAVGSFDLQSIMLYTFKPWMFKKVNTAKCYQPEEASQLSPGDKIGLTYLYPKPNASKPAPETLYGFSMQLTELEQRAHQLKTLSATLRSQSSSAPLVRPRSPHALRHLEIRASSIEAESVRLLTEADTFRLQPDTVRLLEEALNLYDDAK